METKTGIIPRPTRYWNTTIIEQRLVQKKMINEIIIIATLYCV